MRSSQLEVGRNTSKLHESKYGWKSHWLDIEDYLK